MKIKAFFIIFNLVLSACSTSKKTNIPLEDKDLSWVENSDFKPVEEIAYVPVDDFYAELDDSVENPIADEGYRPLRNSSNKRSQKEMVRLEVLYYAIKERSSKESSKSPNFIVLIKRIPFIIIRLVAVFKKEGVS